jgi:glycosyltransferase involved in cell wall biosynthesis
LGLAPEAFYVGGVFRLDAEKRPRDFLEVAERVTRACPRARFVHMGAGAQAEQVQALAARRGLLEGDRLRFLGRQEDPWAWLRVCDASLLTSAVEGLPNAALESQAHGVPIVLTRAGGAPESLIPGQTGLLLEVGDVEGLAQALVGLADDPERRAAMGQAGRSWIRERFSIARMAAEHEALYRAPPPDEARSSVS